jgi:hypothetical protein
MYGTYFILLYYTFPAPCVHRSEKMEEQKRRKYSKMRKWDKEALMRRRQRRSRKG